MSITTTVIFHFTAYFCIIYRAIRIFTVMKLEKKYLDKIYKLAQLDNQNQHNDDLLSSHSSNSNLFKGFGIYK